MKNLLIPTILGISLVACDNLCETKIVNEVPSPSNTYVATVLERGCGTTTPMVTIVTLKLATSKLEIEDTRNWVFTVHGQSDVMAEWLNDATLKISHSWTGDKPTQMESWGKIKILY